MIGFEVTMGETGKLANLGERAMTIAGHKVQEQIRTFSQNYMMSPDGVTFKELTPAYRRSKIRAGYSGLPNFTRTGAYMREMKARKVDGGVEVGPLESDLPRAEGLSKERPHIGLAPETPGIIEAALVEEFERYFA